MRLPCRKISPGIQGNATPFLRCFRSVWWDRKRCSPYPVITQDGAAFINTTRRNVHGIVETGAVAVQCRSFFHFFQDSWLWQLLPAGNLEFSWVPIFRTSAVEEAQKFFHSDISPEEKLNEVSRRPNIGFRILQTHHAQCHCAQIRSCHFFGVGIRFKVRGQHSEPEFSGLRFRLLDANRQPKFRFGTFVSI